METINDTSFLTYGLWLSTYKGIADLPEGKEQFYTVYGKAGYQITKRRANQLELHGFIIATSLADFITKTTALRTLFSSSGLKTVNIGNGNISCFAKEGFQVSKVFVQGIVTAKFYIKLTIV